MKRATPVNAERRSQPRIPDGKWRTGLTCIEPNKILMRGYPLDEVMGRLTFGESIYLLFMGEVPTPGIGSLMEAMLVSFIDHGATPPSTLAARNTATTGAPLRACIAAGVLGFGRYHGGDIESCMQFLDSGLSLVRDGMSYRDAAQKILEGCIESGEAIPGFGHRYHTRDPRAARLFQMALELEVDGAHLRMLRAIERALNATRPDGQRIPVNVDGAIAAVCADIGLAASVGHALFIISRVPGLIAQAREEQERERPMRQIDSTAVIYDGPRERRLPGTRK